MIVVTAATRGYNGGMHRRPHPLMLLLALGLSLAGAGMQAASTPPGPAGPQATRPSPPTTHRVLIISIDGGRPDLLLRGDTPRFHALLEESAFTFWARTTAQAITLPSHVSMLSGVSPNQHQIFWNQDLPFARPVYPAVPTLFDLASKAGYTTALVAGKSKFEHLDRPGALSFKWIAEKDTVDDADVIVNAVRILRDHRPEVMFVHFPGTDNVGHAKGWGTPEQMAKFAEVDRHLGTILDTLKELGLEGSTTLIISADHGGMGRVHGPDDTRARTIPWLVRGPGVRKAYDLARARELDVRTEDTFATACWRLKLPMTPNVEGKPVLPAFEGMELMGN